MKFHEGCMLLSKAYSILSHRNYFFLLLSLQKMTIGEYDDTDDDRESGYYLDRRRHNIMNHKIDDKTRERESEFKYRGNRGRDFFQSLVEKYTSEEI